MLLNSVPSPIPSSVPNLIPDSIPDSTFSIRDFKIDVHSKHLICSPDQQELERPIDLPIGTNGRNLVRPGKQDCSERLELKVSN